MLRVLLDSNAVDTIAFDDAHLACVEVAIGERRLELLVTHIQRDELSAVPDAEKRERLLHLASEVNIVTAGFILDVSRLGLAALASDDEVEIYRQVTGGNHRHARDALLLLTARREAVPLITNENRLPKQCAKHGVAAWRPDDLLRRLGC